MSRVVHRDPRTKEEGSMTAVENRINRIRASSRMGKHCGAVSGDSARASIFYFERDLAGLQTRVAVDCLVDTKPGLALGGRTSIPRSGGVSA